MGEASGAKKQDKAVRIRHKPAKESNSLRKSASRIYRSANSWNANVPTIEDGLQRSCSCGQHTIGGGECNACMKNRSLGNLESEYEQEAGGEISASFTVPASQRFHGDFNRMETHTARSDKDIGHMAAGEGPGEDDPQAIVGGEIVSFRSTSDLSLSPIAQMNDEEKAVAKLSYATKSAPKALDCGGFHSQIKWGIDGINEKTAGFVVQKVTFSLKRKKCSGEDNDFIKTYWEAWQVREGKIYIGTSESLHGSDTFRVPPSPDHGGKNYEAGAAKFMPNYEAPNTWGNVPEALSLPSTASEPDGWSDSGTLKRYMRNTFNCCDGATDSKFESDG